MINKNNYFNENMVSIFLNPTILVFWLILFLFIFFWIKNLDNYFIIITRYIISSLNKILLLSNFKHNFYGKIISSCIFQFNNFLIKKLKNNSSKIYFNFKNCIFKKSYIFSNYRNSSKILNFLFKFTTFFIIENYKKKKLTISFNYFPNIRWIDIKNLILQTKFNNLNSAKEFYHINQKIFLNSYFSTINTYLIFKIELFLGLLYYLLFFVINLWI